MLRKFFTILFLLLSVSTFATDRIISLGPVVTKQLYMLGVGDEIVGDTTYCTMPAPAKYKRKVGTPVNANVEKIIELKPDIVFATGLTNKKQISQLRKIGIKNIVTIENPCSYSELCDNFIRIGDAVGKKELAEQLVSKSKMQVAELKKECSKLPTQKVFIQIGANPLFSVAKDSFINDFIEFAGGINIVKSKTNGIYSLEKVIEDKPDVIIISGMGISGKEEKEKWEKYDTIPAVKNNRLYTIDSYELCSPNSVDFPKVLKKIVKMIHPTLGNK